MKQPPAWIRRALFWLVAGSMVGLELAFVLVELGVPIPPMVGVACVVVLFPVGLAVTMVRREAGREAALEPEAWPRWALLGAFMTAAWAGIYLLVGELVDPARVQYWPLSVERHIPVRPAFSLLYVLLYPIFIFPYFVVRDRQVLRRLVWADVAMFVICTAFFLLLPIGVQRPPAPVDEHLGGWVLKLVWGNDFAWNCMPSEHCMAAMIASLAIWEGNRRVGAFALFSTVLIGVSTLFTRQHYAVDVLAGYSLALLVHYSLRRVLDDPRAPSPRGELQATPP